MSKVDFPQYLPTLRTRFRTRREESIDTRFAEFMITWRDEKSKVFVELTIRVTCWTLILVRLSLTLTLNLRETTERRKRKSQRCGSRCILAFYSRHRGYLLGKDIPLWPLRFRLHFGIARTSRKVELWQEWDLGEQDAWLFP